MPGIVPKHCRVRDEHDTQRIWKELQRETNYKCSDRRKPFREWKNYTHMESKLDCKRRRNKEWLQKSSWGKKKWFLLETEIRWIWSKFLENGKELKKSFRITEQSYHVLFTQVWWGILSAFYSKVNDNSLKSISSEGDHKIYIESLAHCDLGLGKREWPKTS